MSGKQFVDLVSMTVADGSLSYISMPLGCSRYAGQAGITRAY